MIVDDLKVKNENTNENVDDAVHTNENVIDFDSDDTVMSQDNDCLTITISTSFSSKILENDSVTTLDEKRQLSPFVQEDLILGLSNKQSYSLNESSRVNDRNNN